MDNKLIWDMIFMSREPSKYPFDNVVTFVYKNCPSNKPKNNTSILELGCGGGNNLQFMSKEGFKVYGIDSSIIAVEIARERLKKEKLKAEISHADFASLPYPDNYFDLVVDRCAITCVDKIKSKKVFLEVNRVLKPQGKFFFNAYSDDHTSCTTAMKTKSGISTSINQGSLTGNGDLSFYNENELKDCFSKNWIIKEMKLKHYYDKLNKDKNLHSEWELNVEKIDKT